MQRPFPLPNEREPLAEGVTGAAFLVRVGEPCEAALRLSGQIEHQIPKKSQVEMPPGSAALLRRGEDVIYAPFPRGGVLLGPASYRMAELQGLDHFRDERRARCQQEMLLGVALTSVGMLLLFLAVSDVRTLTSIGIQLTGLAIAWQGLKRLRGLGRDCLAGRIEMTEVRAAPVMI